MLMKQTHILMPIYKLNSSNQTLRHLSYVPGAIPFCIKASLDFPRLLHCAFCISRDVWEAPLKWPDLTLFSLHSAGYAPEGWRPQALQILTPYSPSLASDASVTWRPSPAQTTLSFCAAQAGKSTHQCSAGLFRAAMQPGYQLPPETFRTEGSTEPVLNGPKVQPWHCTAKATGSSAAHTSSSRHSL